MHVPKKKFRQIEQSKNNRKIAINSGIYWECKSSSAFVWIRFSANSRWCDEEGETKKGTHTHIHKPNVKLYWMCGNKCRVFSCTQNAFNIGSNKKTIDLRTHTLSAVEGCYRCQHLCHHQMFEFSNQHTHIHTTKHYTNIYTHISNARKNN